MGWFGRNKNKEPSNLRHDEIIEEITDKKKSFNVLDLSGKDLRGADLRGAVGFEAKE